MALLDEQRFNTAGEATRKALGGFVKGKQLSTPTPVGDINVRAPSALGATLRTAGKAVGSLPALATLPEAYNTYNDVTTPGMTTANKVARVSEGVGRAAGATAGGMAGAAFGTGLMPVGGTLVGGTLGALAGYAAPDLVTAGLNATIAPDLKLPSQIAEGLRPKVSKAGALAPNAKAPAVNTPPVVKEEPIQFLSGSNMGTLQPLPTRQFNDPTVPKKEAPVQDINKDAQAMVQTALQNLKDTIKNPGKAESLGAALSQKIENKNAMNIANAELQAANTLSQLASNSVNLRKGENELSQQDQLKKTLQEYQSEASKPMPTDPKAIDERNTKLNALRSLALTLQGKEAKPQFEFMQVGGADEPKRVVKVNPSTGTYEEVGGAKPNPYAGVAVGEKIARPDGSVIQFNGYNDAGVAQVSLLANPKATQTKPPAKLGATVATQPQNDAPFVFANFKPAGTTLYDDGLPDLPPELRPRSR